MKSDQEFHIVGPFNAFEYISEAMYIISQDGVYDLDIINEVAMDIYYAYKEVEYEYEDARKRLAEYPGDSEWTVQNEVDAARSYRNLPQDILKTIFEQEEILSTLNTLNTLDTLDELERRGNGYDPFDVPF